MKRTVKLTKDRDCHACEKPMKRGEEVTYWVNQDPSGDTTKLVCGHWCAQCSVWAKEVNDMGETVWSGAFLDRRLAMEQPRSDEGKD